MLLTFSIILLAVEVILLGIYIYLSYKRKNIFDKSNAIFLAPIFVVMFCFYLVSALDNESYSFIEIIQCFTGAIKSFTFEVVGDSIAVAFSKSVVFSIAFCLGLFMSALTVVDSFIGIFRTNIFNFFRVIRAKKKRYTFVLSLNEESMEYIKNNNCIVMGDSFTDAQYFYLFENNIPYIKKGFNRKGIKSLKLNLKDHNAIYNFVDFNYSENNYFEYMSELIKLFDGTRYNEHVFLHLNISVEKISLFKENILDRYGLNINVLCFSIQELIARNFVYDYPLAKFMPSDFIDSLGCLNVEKEVNIIFLGFGRKNQELMKSLVLNTQFPGFENGQYFNKLINYYAFDNNSKAINNPQFHEMYRQINSVGVTNSCEPICNFKFIESDFYENKLGDEEVFMEKLTKIVSNKNSFNYIIISFGDDLARYSLVNTLQKTLKNDDNIQYFVYQSNDFELPKGVIGFGKISSLYKNDAIIDNLHIKTAMKIHGIYSLLSCESRYQQLRAWGKLPLIDQYSNVYAALNIRHKLSLLGLDVSTETEGIDQQTYYEILFQEDVIRKEELLAFKDYKYYFRHTLRNTIAYQEHLRWCTYYILNDYQTMSLDDVVILDGAVITKSKNLKLHSCLVDYLGLDKLHQKLAQLKQEPIESLETYKYDFMVVDNLFEEVSKLGFKIIKK